MAYTLDVERGYINTYTPIKFDYTSIEEHKKLINKIQKNFYVISKHSKITDGNFIKLKKEFYDICDLVTSTYAVNRKPNDELPANQNKLDENPYFKINNVFDYDHSQTLINKDSVLLNYVKPQVQIEFPTIKVILVNEIQKFSELMVEEVVDSANFSARFFGSDIAQNKTVISLWPILVKDKNDDYLIAPVEIEFFELGLAILKISYPIKNQSSLGLSLNDFDSYHNEIFYPPIFHNNQEMIEFDYLRICSNKIDDIIKMIIEWLNTLPSGFIKTQSMKFIILSQLKKGNLDFNKTSKDEKEFLYRIVNAPLPDNKIMHPEHNQTWGNSYWGNGPFRYYFSSMGKCVALLDKNLDVEFLKGESEESRNHIIDTSIVNNVENAYKILLLTELNYRNLLIKQNINNSYDLEVIQEDFLRTENYLLQLFDTSYGTVRDLYAKMIELNHNFINRDNVEKRINNNDLLLKTQREKKLAKGNDIVTFLGLIITLLVSLKSIYETLLIIRTIFPYSNDIPHISVIGFSVFVDIVFIILLVNWYRNRSN